MTGPSSNWQAVDDPDDGLKGCLLLVASYAETASVVRDVTATAQRRILLSPGLADVVEVHFVELGPRPVGPDDKARLDGLVRRLTTTTNDDLAVCYSALLVIDETADSVDRLLAHCREHPVLARIPMARRGLAVTGTTARPALAWDEDAVLVSPGEFWSEEDLLAQVSSFAEELLLMTADGRLAGLSPSALRALARAGRGLHASPDGSGNKSAPATPPSPTPPGYSQPDDSRPDYPAPPQQGHSAPAEPEPLRQAGPPVDSRRPVDPEQPLASSGPRPLAPVFLVLCGLNRAVDRAGWRRGQGVLRAVDRRLAAAPEGVFKVWGVVNVEESARGSRRPTGPLSWLRIRWAGTPAGIAGVFAAMAQSLRRELAAARAGGPPAALPTIVIYTVEPPPTDDITLACYRELARLAPIYWVTREGTAHATAAPFLALGAAFILDHSDVSAEIAARIRDYARITPSSY